MIDLRIVDALAQGRDELGLLLYSGASPAWLARRTDDGRSDSTLKDAWLTKVCSSGLPKEFALRFLNDRISME